MPLAGVTRTPTLIITYNIYNKGCCDSNNKTMRTFHTGSLNPKFSIEKFFPVPIGYGVYVIITSHPSVSKSES